MRITKIEIKHFRGFPGPATYTFNLAGGKNLLLYGENGSGKSSLYYALDQLFNIDSNAPSFAQLANVFARDEHENEITDGFVKVYLDDNPPTVLIWSQAGGRPLGNPRLVDAAMRKGCLDYRALLRTSFVERNLDAQLFGLAVEVLLARISVPLGGTPRTIGEYWGEVRTPSSHRQTELQQAEDAINQFNIALKAILPEVERKATELLVFFTDPHLRLHLQFDDLLYEKSARVINNQKLGLDIEFNGRSIPNHENFLNEARLSAIALSLYLASVLLINPAPQPGAPQPLKLLVLDDVLIGLDLSHRLPLLEILVAHFSDYQIILSTFDNVWYDLAKCHTKPSNRWTQEKLFSDRFGDPGYEVPVLMGGRSLLQRAQEHLNNHDHRAAAVYARSAFESKLKNFCDSLRVPVRYRKDPHRVSADDLWQAASSFQRGGTTVIDATSKSHIEALRKVVLNPLSHADANSITRAEVQAAIAAVEGLPCK